MNTAGFKGFAILFFSISAFIVFSLLAKPGMLFYEGKIYLQYLSSMISDYDFNIINQVPKPMSWLVTGNYFHPDHHSESQTAIMMPFYFLEFLSKKLSFSTIPSAAYEFQFSLSTLALNFFSLLLGFYFLFKACLNLSLRVTLSDFAAFTLGTALFYFSFLQSSVLEVTAFPLLSYLIMSYLSEKTPSRQSSPAILGIACGFLFISKITFWPACLGFGLVFCFRFFKAKRFSDLIYFSAGFVPILAAAIINNILKYGYFFPAATVPPVHHFFDFSFENFNRNLIYGFFPEGGLFFANPIYFLAVVGFFLFLIFLFREKKVGTFIFATSLVWFVLAFFGHLNLSGYIVEDHLPGRIHLAFLPMLFLGFVYLKSRMPVGFSRPFALLCLLSVAWHLFITAGYLVMIQGSSFLYAGNMVPKKSLISVLLPKYLARVNENATGIAAHIWQILVFALFLTTIFYFIYKSLHRERILRLFVFFCSLMFLLSTCLNLIFSSKNVETMKDQGFFQTMAIGNGAEIFHLEYVLQYVKTAKIRCSPAICKNLDLGLKDYYSAVPKQLIRSTESLNKAVAEASPDFSYWVEIELKK